MMKLARPAAIVAAGLLACGPAAGQRLNAFPPAGAVSPTDTVIGQQPSLCQAASCNGVQISLAQLRAFTLLGNASSASKLAAATTINGVAFDGSATTYTLPAVDTATPRVPTSLTISTVAPLAGGGALTGNLALSIGAASGTAAGTMSAADKSKLDGVSPGASVSSVACTSSGGLSCSVSGATGAASITLTPAANVTAIAGLGTAADQCVYWTGSAAASLYGCPGFGRSLVASASAAAAQSTLGLGSAATYAIGTSGTTVGLLNGSNTYSGAMTFTQLITGSVSGNAGTSTKLATARNINGVAFDGSAAITINAVDAAARLAAGNNLSDVANAGTARANIGAAASGANNDITSMGGLTTPLSIAQGGTGRTTATTGTAFPTSPATNDRFFRSDRGIGYYYDGTRWLSDQTYTVALIPTDMSLPVTATKNYGWRGTPPSSGLYDAYVVDVVVTRFVSATSSWTYTIRAAAVAGGSDVTLATSPAYSDTTNQWVSNRISVGSVVSKNNFEMDGSAALNSGSANLYALFQVTYRLVG